MVSFNFSADPGFGGHRDSGSTSFLQIGAAFIPTALLALGYLIAFFVLKGRFPNIYSPRTYFKTIPEKARTPSSKSGRHSWWQDFIWIDDKFILRNNSLEAYLFLRFFRIVMLICFVGCLLTWPILFPVNYTGGGSSTQLDRLTFSNCVKEKSLYAHAVVAWVFILFILLLITRERMFLIGIKQAYFTSTPVAQRLSSRTVLFLSVPAPAFEDNNLKKYFGPSAKRSWKVPKVGDLESLVNKRNNHIYGLEKEELKLAKNVNSIEKGGPSDVNDDPEEARALNDPEDTSIRPKFRTIPLFGKLVDSIDHHLHKLPDVIEDINAKRKNVTGRGAKTGGALFVEFEDQLSAHQAYQSVGHHTPLAMQPRFIGLQPKEVLWQNLALSPLIRIIITYAIFALLVATIIFWAVPIGFIGTISNITYLSEEVSWLSWIQNLPSGIVGLIQGLLPPALVSYVVSYVPKLFRMILKFAGAPTTVDAEERVQEWYFAFQVIQVFLVTTFSSGAASVISQLIDRPASALQILADNLPKASNFYLTYFILQGTSSAANNLLNYSDLFSYVFFDRFWDKTPREKYDRLAFLEGCPWGAWYPKFANFAVIAIAYSCIAPLVLGFAGIGLFFFAMSYRYSLLYTKQVKVETRGDAYAMTLQHILTGVYLLELCMIGLFSTRKAEGPVVLTVILLISTILYHITVNRFLSPLEENIAMDVMTEEDPEDPLIQEEPAINGHGGKPKKTVVQRVAGGNLPAILLDPLASVLEPRLFTPHETLALWLAEDDIGADSMPEYTEQEYDDAYMHPAIISNTPKIWLAKDRNNVSKWAIEKFEAAGFKTSDEGAELDESNHVIWNVHDQSTAPIFKETKEY